MKSEYQGLGLGKAVVLKEIEKALSIEGNRDIYLHTQTTHPHTDIPRNFSYDP